MVVAIANPDTHRDSEPGTVTETTNQFQLATPTAAHFAPLSATTDSVTVTFTGAPPERVTVYLFGILNQETGSYKEQSTAVPVSDGSYRFIDLMPDTEYAVEVVSSRAEDMGDYVESDPEYEFPLIRTQALPQLATPQNVQATATADSITATWNEVANASSYDVSLYEGNAISSTLVGTQTIGVADQRTATFTNVTQGTEYTVAVVAKANPATHRDSEAGTATARIIVDDRTKLATPTQISFTATTRSITVSWMDVPEEVSTYSITVVGSSFNAQESAAVRNATSEVFSNLEPTEVYNVSIIAQGDPAQ